MGGQVSFYFLIFYEAFSNVNHFFSATEQPSSLHSSQGLRMGPVEESWFASFPEHQQEENELSLQNKLQEEANYHLFGSRMDRQTKEQPRQNVAYNRDEERKRRVSHDPFAQPRPYENVQKPGIKGLAPTSTTSQSNAVHQPTGLTSQPQVLYWNNASFGTHVFGTRPLDVQTVGSRVWCGPNPSQMPSLPKTPVPETTLLGNTPTIPFVSFPSRGKQAFQLQSYLFLFFLKIKQPLALVLSIDNKGQVVQSLQRPDATCHHGIVHQTTLPGHISVWVGFIAVAENVGLQVLVTGRHLLL